VWVFFYGSYMNFGVLREVDLVPEQWEVGQLNGFDIRIVPSQLTDLFPVRRTRAREPMLNQSVPVRQCCPFRRSVCQHRLTLFSSARLRLSLARAGKQSDLKCDRKRSKKATKRLSENRLGETSREALRRANLHSVLAVRPFRLSAEQFHARAR
jgi:hypothetical protein